MRRKHCAAGACDARLAGVGAHGSRQRACARCDAAWRCTAAAGRQAGSATMCRNCPAWRAHMPSPAPQRARCLGALSAGAVRQSSVFLKHTRTRAHTHTHTHILESSLACSCQALHARLKAYMLELDVLVLPHGLRLSNHGTA